LDFPKVFIKRDRLQPDERAAATIFLFGTIAVCLLCQIGKKTKAQAPNPLTRKKKTEPRAKRSSEIDSLAGQSVAYPNDLLEQSRFFAK
jgi:hypothetical protein